VANTPSHAVLATRIREWVLFIREGSPP